jgi:hypothetical protein
MARLTKEERAELEARLADDDDDDEADEVEIGLGDGKYFRGSYRRAKALGHVTEPAKPKDGDGKKPGRVSVLSPRTRAAGSQ